MHLVGPYMTTTRYNNKKKKNRSKKLQAAHEEHTKWLESKGVGKTKLPTNAKGQRTGINEIPDYSTGPRVTSDRVAANGTSKERIQYTGHEIMGITLNHKSNYEPVRRDNKQAAIESAKMRR